MSVRLKITFLFTIIVFIILSLVCGTVYYISYTTRINNIKTRLTNRAITTARLLTQEETFDSELIQKIDSSTEVAINRKILQAYNNRNEITYSFSDYTDDTLYIKKNILDDARVRGIKYFAIGDKDAIALHYVTPSDRMVMVAAGIDVTGRRNLDQLQFILLLSFLGGLLIALITGYIFSKKLLQPIRKIADEVNEISAQNLTRRMETGKVKDEWYYLSDTLNSLLNRLQESFETQQRFISNASHELSTPLTSISSQLEVALQRERDAKEYQRVMQSIYQDVRHMSKLTQTLLEFAKASGSAGGLEINLIRVDEILMRLPSEAVKANSEYQVKLSFEELPEEENDLFVFGNEELLFTAVKNIVLNACKYSPDKTASVKFTVKDADVYIDVEDKGVGVSQSDYQTIFEPFYRVDESRQTEGFGLGLSLTKRIIKLHKGEISVHSEKGVGTVFSILLPSASKLKDF